jgi:hypothetical protein
MGMLCPLLVGFLKDRHDRRLGGNIVADRIRLIVLPR